MVDPFDGRRAVAGRSGLLCPGRSDGVVKPFFDQQMMIVVAPAGLEPALSSLRVAGELAHLIDGALYPILQSAVPPMGIEPMACSFAGSRACRYTSAAYRVVRVAPDGTRRVTSTSGLTTTIERKAPSVDGRKELGHRSGARTPTRGTVEPY